MRWFLVLRHMTRPFADWQDRLGQHLEWLHAQHARGAIVISGPSADRRLGLYVMRAPSREEAAATAAQDPLAREDLARIEVIEWDVHQILGAGPFTLDAMRASEQA
jgi:uncharacterized protein YciI